MAVRKSGIYYSVLITRGKEGRKKGIGVNVLIGKRKEDVEVEEVKEGRVTAEDYCREWLRVDRGQCARRGVHTIRCLDLARRRVDEAAMVSVHVVVCLAAGSLAVVPSPRQCCSVYQVGCFRAEPLFFRE